MSARPAPASSLEGASVLVVGLGRSGTAVSARLLERGARVVVVDDAPDGDLGQRAGELGVELVPRPSEERLEALVAGCDLVVPSPGVPPHHPVFGVARAQGVPVRSEVELASTWTNRPLVAVTGTNGKTTVTALVADMLVASGRPALAAGNIGLTLSEAVGLDAEVLVVEVSSFQLEFTESFRPAVGVWLNLAVDHLDWHSDLGSYAAAKARIWARQGPADVAVANAEDPLVMAAAAGVAGRLVTFGLAGGDYRSDGDWLVGPEGPLVLVEELWRRLPHDVADALAASAAALAAGATPDGVRAGLRGFRGLPHRISAVAEAGGVRWYDDSKATNPHAALAAVRSFESVVLVAGGRNKGLDLDVLATEADRVRALVAIGEAAPALERAFAGRRPVAVAGSMDEAVELAAGLAVPGDVVLLAPACASFDWYGSYAERGDDFARAVRRHLAAAAGGR